MVLVPCLSHPFLRRIWGSQLSSEQPGAIVVYQQEFPDLPDDF